MPSILDKIFCTIKSLISGPKSLSQEVEIAIQTGKMDKMEECLTKGEDINSGDKRGWLPLFMAVDNFSYGAFGDDVLKFLLRKGADINIGRDNHASILSGASGNPELLKFLISNGADVNISDVWGRIQLHHAVEEGHLENVEIFLSNGADINAKDENGETPLDLISEKNLQGDFMKIAILLRKSGAMTSDEL